jgi:hypothetical protein
LLLLFAVCLLSPQCFAEPPLSDAEYHKLREKKEKVAEDFMVLNRERKYRVFRPIKVLLPQVVLRGSASKLGLDYERLEDHLKLQFVDNLKDYMDVSSPNMEELGFFVCVIWTVRESYPIALSVTCRASVMHETEDWHEEALGIVSEEKVKATVRETLDDYVEEFAVFFLKAKGIL